MTDLELGRALDLEQWNEHSPLPEPHDYTVALAMAACSFKANPSFTDDRVRAERARLCWVAWITWSSHSTMRAAAAGTRAPNFHSLLVA